uniref:Uncharacterized protein n=1 Tax=viral metagenome TaxID=1070528 RepID=A0A6H2A4H3_9ZZZZ
MLLIDDIYKRSKEIVASLDGLPVNEQELVLFYALRLAQHDALMDELETKEQNDPSTRG